MNIRLIELSVVSVVFALIGIMVCDSFAVDKMEPSELSEALAQVELFDKLTDAERGVLEAAATLRDGKAGKQMIEQGKKLDKMFILLNGRAEVIANGERVAVLSGRPLLGEIEFLDKGPGSADAFLIEDTKFIELDNAELNKLMEKHHRIGYVLMHEIAKIEAVRLRATNQKSD
ncbi:MAG: cyclic nucleotide-binding domain-containing protein [Verrucomicrobia bacterium]|nr:cyclic nucleotide-binding domain-containing protein [Verrucomicrobiota bacterium]MCF7708841.1 cyclic nucleotide-binding domain-containing protein [Verrucomicrobiota bacterium]